MTVFETLDRVMLADTVTLKLKCGSCGHQDEWSRQMALANLGHDAVPLRDTAAPNLSGIQRARPDGGVDLTGAEAGA